MNILVCIKQIRQVYVQNGACPGTNTLNPEGHVHVINPHDENAVEEALRIRQANGCGNVSLLSLGPPRVQKALRWCLAMGADTAFHIVADRITRLDPWAVSLSLTRVVRESQYDLILSGKKSLDGETGAVGAYVAELLNLPMVSAAAKIELAPRDGTITVQRALGRGNREIVECPLPAVVTVEKGVNRPRYPTFEGRKTAFNKTIRSIPLASLGPLQEQSLKAPVTRVSRFDPPRPKPRKIVGPPDGLSVHDRVKWILTGGMSSRKGGVLNAEPDKLAARILEFLEEKKIITLRPQPIDDKNDDNV
jgi:electron transfer flavoprotein beta subunit